MGENFLLDTLESWGWKANLLQDRCNQARGRDIEFNNGKWKNYYTADIKNNLKYNKFYVEMDDAGWLFNPNKDSHRIWHVDPETGQMVWYDRNDMRRFLSPFKREGLKMFDINSMPNFCSYRVVNV